MRGTPLSINAELETHSPQQQTLKPRVRKHLFIPKIPSWCSTGCPHRRTGGKARCWGELGVKEAVEGLPVQSCLSPVHRPRRSPGSGMCAPAHGLLRSRSGRGMVSALEASRGTWQSTPASSPPQTCPHYGLFEIRGQGPRVRQPVLESTGRRAGNLESRLREVDRSGRGPRPTGPRGWES